MQLLLLASVVATSLVGGSDKLDTGLDSFAGTRAVFVRMEAQLFKKGGDFVQFCKENEKKTRSAVRKDVIATLHQKADKSWDGIKGYLASAEAKKGMSDIQRFWILNGFACDVDAATCRELSERPDVSFVYVQSGPTGLKQNQKRVRRANRNPDKKKVMESVMKRMKDDSDEPFSAKDLEVAWDLKQIQADQVWEKEGVFGKGIVVAVNDAGIYDIPSLENALWRNPKESLNGKDNDGNGYIGDIFGWDAGEQSGDVLGNAGVSHGTMCSAIIAGRPTAEKKVVTGVAPRSRLMIMNGMGYLATFEYALANGADVFSMSYMFVNMQIGNYRGVYRLAAEHITAAGVLLCGGAGNYAKSAPEGKQIAIPKDIPCVLAVAGTQEDGSRPAFSSMGPVTWSGVKFYDDYPKEKPLMKPDVSAPASGFTCWGLATDLRPQWKIQFTGAKGDVLVKGPQGNSFAGPHAAGVAALMFSANREMHPWQVKRILEQTCKDMGPTGRDVLHGEGVIQALEAVREAKKLKSSS